MNTRENINKRLINEIKKIEERENIKDFLENLLMEENSNSFGYVYKEEYKKMVSKYINKKDK